MKAEQNFENFTKIVEQKVKDRLEGCEIGIEMVPKNNGVLKTALIIRNPDANAEPCIYLEEYYNHYRKEIASIDGIVDHIIKIYDENKLGERMDVDVLLQYPTMRPKIRGRLISTQRNTDMLQNVPHREILDLSLIYTIEVNTRRGIGNIIINHSHLEIWGVTEPELFMQLKKNLEQEEGCFMHLDRFLTQILDVPEEETLRDSLPDIFIMSNKDKHYGAVELLNEKTVEKAVKTFGGSFYILPSSVHELILLPGGCEDMTLDGLAEMVASINASDVNESDVLSSHIYYYNAEEKRLEMHR